MLINVFRLRDVLQVSIRRFCLGGFLLTSQGAIRLLNLHKQADFVNSPHKDINTRDDVICLFLPVSHTLINLHAFLKTEKAQRALLPQQGFSVISRPDKTIWAVWQGEATSDKQIEHCVWVDHVLKDRWVAKTYLTVSWRDRSFLCWVRVAGLHCGSWRLSGVESRRLIGGFGEERVRCWVMVDGPGTYTVSCLIWECYSVA